MQFDHEEGKSVGVGGGGDRDNSCDIFRSHMRKSRCLPTPTVHLRLSHTHLSALGTWPAFEFTSCKLFFQVKSCGLFLYSPLSVTNPSPCHINQVYPVLFSGCEPKRMVRGPGRHHYFKGD